MNIRPVGINDLKAVHEKTRMETRKSGEESGEESGDESNVSDEEDDLDDEAFRIQTNLNELESKMMSDSSDFLEYSYTRLPCAAHKVRLDSL